jgi:protease I
MNNKRIIIPIPNYGFDPTETAIPWKIISEKKFEIVFATPDGQKAEADSKMHTGESLGVMKRILLARQDAIDAYHEMEKSKEFCSPLKYSDIKESDFAAILLPGGHHKAVKEYLESKVLQKIIVDFFRAHKPVAAICHGVVLVARSIDPNTGKSVIYNYKTTALLKSQELGAYYLTKWWLKDYYLTYPEMSVQDETASVLFHKKNFIKGPLPLLRDSREHLGRGFTVKDRNYLSARWPGDAYNFAFDLVKMIEDQLN